MDATKKEGATMAQQIAQAAIASHQERTGHSPEAASVILSEDTLIITLHGALSPAEQALAKSQRVRLTYRSFTNNCSSTPASRYVRRLKESPASSCAMPRRKSRPQPVPLCNSSRPARWCRCSSWPKVYR